MNINKKEYKTMKNLYGLTNIQVFVTEDINELNQFLLEYNANIIEIQITNDTYNDHYHVVYKYKED
jgi:hypothetical protein